MADIFDYISRRGDLTFEQDGFNELDALVLSRLSYLPFDGAVSSCLFDEITLEQAAMRVFATDDYEKNLLWKGDADLLRATAESKRFGKILVSGYVNEVESDVSMQFSAITFEFLKMNYFISYRGTDNSLVGWQEDFNMFFTFPLPSQKKALDYFEKAVRMLNGKFILGGHSKGGNLAVYAGAFTDENSRNHIDYIYNFDGPGFSLDKIRDSGFYEIDDRIYTFVPQSSIFGMMFEHEESYTIVKSNQKGFLQHDIYSWEIEQNRLVRLKSTTNFSVFFDHTLKEFVESLTIAQRREFTKEVFALLSLTETATFNEMLKNPLKNTGTILKSFAGLDSKTRNMLLKTIFAFVKSAKNNFSDITGGQNKITKKLIYAPILFSVGAFSLQEIICQDEIPVLSIGTFGICIVSLENFS